MSLGRRLRATKTKGCEPFALHQILEHGELPRAFGADYGYKHLIEAVEMGLSKASGD